MKGNNKLLKLILTVYVIVVLGIIAFNILEPLLYNKNSKGIKTTNDNIYDVAHGIVAKKYEIILYDDIENLYDVFSYNCKSNLKQSMNTNVISELLDSFISFQITNIEVVNTNKYIIYYNEEFDDTKIKENKMVIKYKNDKAIIYYDSIMEASYE